MPLVLVVDDNAVFARLVARELRFRGIEVRVAGSGADVPRVLDDQEMRALDAAWVDQALPDARGTEIAARIRAKNTRANLVLVSAVANNEEIRADIIHRNISFFPKPVTLAEIRGWGDGVIERSPSAKFERVLDRIKAECGLTTKEIDVIRAARESSVQRKAIAAQLNISVETVGTHVQNIKRKTRVSSLRDLLERLHVDDNV